MPSIPGILMSVKTASYFSAAILRSASAPSLAVTTTYPRPESTRSKLLPTTGSSSTIRIFRSVFMMSPFNQLALPGAGAAPPFELLTCQAPSPSRRSVQCFLSIALLAASITSQGASGFAR